MLDLLKQDAQVGDSLNLYLTTGDSVKGIIIEIGDNNLLLDVEGVQRRYFPQLIGGWDVVRSNDSNESSTYDQENKTSDIEKGEPKKNEEFEYGLISMFDDIYKENHYEPTEKIITNGTVESITVSGVKVVTDDGEIVVCHKGFMVGFSRANCTPGKRVFCGAVNSKGSNKGICFLSVLEMSYEELRTRYVTAILTKPTPRKPVINSILAYLRNISTEKSAVKIVGELRKRIKTINDSIDELISRKDYEKVFLQLEKSIESSTDNKQKSSLLLKKAQLYSSLKDNAKAIVAYKELISFNESIDAPANNLSHLYTELARLLLIIGDEENSNEARNRALMLNPKNSIARRIGSDNNPSNQGNDKNNRQIIKESDGLLEAVKFTDNNLIDDDIERHSFTDPEIVSLNSEVTNEIANRLLEDASTSEEYAPHLEAAKALKNLPVGSYDIQGLEDSIKNYSLYKCLSIFNSYKKVVYESDSVNNIPNEQLNKIKDCAVCYSLEAIENFADEDNDIMIKLLTNCLLLELSSLLIKENKSKELLLEVLDLKTEDFVKRCITFKWSTYVPALFIKLVSYSIQCSNLWDSVILKSPNYIYLLSYVNDNTSIKEKIVALTPKGVNREVNSVDYIDSFRRYVSVKLASSYSCLKNIGSNKLDLSSLRPIQKKSKLLSKDTYIWCFNDTDQKTVLDISHIVTLLSLYQKKSKEERKSILSNVMFEIEELLRWNNSTNATKLGRFFFYPLLVSWKEYLSELDTQDKYKDQCLLSVEMDSPYYYVNGDNNKRFKVILHNKGNLISEGYQLNIWVGENSNNGFVKEDNIIILPNTDVQIEIPIPIDKWGNYEIYELNFAISSKYQDKWSNTEYFNASITNKRDVSFGIGEIKWHDSGNPPQEMFKGRDAIVQDLKEHYCSHERRYSYVLYGLSRTGKSSILDYLRKAIEGCEIVGTSLKIIVLPLIIDLGEIYGNTIDGKFWEEFIDCIFKTTEAFILKYRPEKTRGLLRPNDLKQYITDMNELRIHPLFMFDEFSFMQNIINDGYINSAFLQYMRTISADKDLASFIFAGTYDIKQLIHDQKYNISGAFTYLREPDKPIFEISSQAAEELINVMQGKLDFSPAAIREIHRLTGDVPFWIQKLCLNCGIYAVENNRPFIGISELEKVVRKMTGEPNSIGNKTKIPTMNEGTFEKTQTLRTDTDEMKIVLTSISFLIKESKSSEGITYDEIKDLWAEKGCDISNYNIKEAIDSLCERKTLVYEDINNMRYYRFSIDLFRRWWLHEHFVFDLELSTFKKIKYEV